MRRRAFASAALAAAACGKPPGKPSPPWRPRLLLRSGWQIENIGDIAHTPGMLRLLELHAPEADVTLWSNALGGGVREMLARNFPRLEIVSGQPGSAAIDDAFRRADFLLHGSGPSVVAAAHLEAWRKQTGKPYGILGVTIAADAPPGDVLRGAVFVFARETASLANLRPTGVQGANIGFAPDATFSLKLTAESTAKAFLRSAGLEAKQFIAVVPRLRYTPYHRMRKTDWPAATVRKREEVNARHQEADHAKLRQAIITWVRSTGRKVLLCPEMTYQVEILGPLLYDPLPADVKPRVVRRETYWLTDEASSVYRRAVAVVSFECHSPIIAAVNDTPCIYVRQPEDGIKGQMWKDVGLGDWCFDVETDSGAGIAHALMAIHENYAVSQVRVHEAVIYARKLQAGAMARVRAALGLARR